MCNIFSVYLAKKDSPSEAYATLWLPAQPYELLDALDRLRLQEGEEMHLEMDEYLKCEYLAPFLDEQCSLYELNALATQLSSLSDLQLIAFEGLVEVAVQKKEGPIEIQKLINLAYSTDCCHVVEDALNDSQLGHFFCENGFFPELDDIPDKVYEMLDFEAIGRKLRMDEGGTFTPHGYVVQHSDLEQAPADITASPVRPDYTMRLICDNYNYDDPGQELVRVPVNLPATDDELDAALGQLDAPNWDSVIIREYDGAFSELPYISDMLFDGIDQINDFAKAIQQLEQEGQLVKFKAVIAATGCNDLDMACALADHIDEYLLDSGISSPRELALENIHSMCCPDNAERIAKYVNLYGYGEDILQKEHAVISPYGMVCRRDHEPLEEYEDQLVQSTGMEMK